MTTDHANRLWRALCLLAPDVLAGCAREHRFHPTRRWRFDLAWPDRKLAVEVDGGQWMAGGGRHNSDADREKLNAAAIAGWRVLRYSPRQLDDIMRVIEEIRAALAWRQEKE
jgi:very-short-patch-repair endonuclease